MAMAGLAWGDLHLTFSGDPGDQVIDWSVTKDGQGITPHPTWFNQSMLTFVTIVSLLPNPTDNNWTNSFAWSNNGVSLMKSDLTLTAASITGNASLNVDYTGASGISDLVVSGAVTDMLLREGTNQFYLVGENTFTLAATSPGDVESISLTGSGTVDLGAGNTLDSVFHIGATRTYTGAAGTVGTYSISAVPEPSAFLTGLLAFVLMGSRRSRPAERPA